MRHTWPVVVFGELYDILLITLPPVPINHATPVSCQSFLTAAQQLLSSKPTINHVQPSIINPNPYYNHSCYHQRQINHHTSHSTPAYYQLSRWLMLMSVFFLLNSDCSQQFADTSYSAKRWLMLHQQCYACWMRARLVTTQRTYATVSKYFVLTERVSYSINRASTSIIYTSNFALAVLKRPVHLN